MTDTHSTLSILQKLVDAVDATGGVELDKETWTYNLVADPDWIDMADIAVQAHEEIIKAGWSSKLKGYDT